MSWDCNADTTTIVTNEAENFDVQLFSGQGRLTADRAEVQDLPGRSVFIGPYVDDFFSLRVTAIDGRNIETLAKTVQVGDACTGERIFQRYADPEAEAPATPAKPDDAPKGPAPFVDPTKDPFDYVKRYVEEETYRNWFDESYGEEYGTICAAVGLAEGCIERYNQMLEDVVPPPPEPVVEVPEPVVEEPEPEPVVEEPEPEPVVEEPEPEVVAPEEPEPEVVEPEEPEPVPPAEEEEASGCLIATAAYGTEMAPQLQALREVRDGTLLATGSGTAFMSAFNTAYYSFSPAVADMERQSPLFRQAVQAFIAPMIATLSVVMPLAETHSGEGSEGSVVAYGIASLAILAGMYVAAPAYVIHRTGRALRRRRD